MKALLRSVHSFLTLVGRITLVASVMLAIISSFTFFISKDKPKIDFNLSIQETRSEFYRIFNNPELSKTKENRQMLAIYRTSICGLVGEGCTDNPSDGDKNINSSLFGMIGGAIAYPFSNAPASGMYWTRMGLENMGFIPKTYAAQGIGFSGLYPIISIWKLMRDAALLIIVLVIVSIGFLIMFRVKINAQTVVTLENSLPRIVIALILIVFSFPIGGFMIDMMYVVSALAISLLSSNTVYNIAPGSYQAMLFGGSTSKLFDVIFWNSDAINIGQAIFSIMPLVVNLTVRVGLIVLADFLLFKALPSPVKAAAQNTDTPLIETVKWQIFMYVLVTVVAILAPLILSLLIILFTSLAVFIRIFIAIFKAYIKILLRIIFSPMILMLEAIPGRKMFSGWVRGLIGDLMIIPITVILAMVSTIIVNIPREAGALWQPPFIHASPARAIYVLIGMGILYAIPNIHKMAKQFIGIKEQPSGMGLGLFTGGLTGVGGTAMEQFSKLGGVGHALSMFDKNNGPIGKLLTKFKK